MTSPDPEVSRPDRAAQVSARGLTRAGLTVMFVVYAVVGLLWVVTQTPTKVSGGDVDFFAVLDSSLQLRHGQPLYGAERTTTDESGTRPANPNLNHPAIAVAMLPLTYLPPGAAFVVWTALGFFAIATALWRLRPWDALGIHAQDPRLWLAIAGCPGILYCIYLGQFGLIMALATAMAWAQLRRHAWFRCGVVVGILIVLKPFLWPLAAAFVTRRARIGLVGAVTGAAAVSLAALPLVGIEAYSEWLTTLQRVAWHGNPYNVSVVGVAARVVSASPAMLNLAGGLISVVFIAIIVYLGRSESEKFSALLVVTLVATPLGWLYYVPLLLPAANDLGSRGINRRQMSSLLVVSVVLLWTPVFVISLAETTAWNLTLGAAYTWGLLGLLAAFAPLRSSLET